MAYTENDRKYFQKNKAKILEKRRRKKKDNPEWATRQAVKARAASLAWYRAHKDEVAEKRRTRSEEDRRKNKDNFLKTKYGITLQQWERMFSDQDGKCMICKKRKKLCVDHDHETGEVRALLCRWCNTMLGDSGDNPEILMLGALYIEEYS